MIKTIFATLIILCVLVGAMPVTADESENGRFKVIKSTEGIMYFLDTKEGHIWEWFYDLSISEETVTVKGQKISTRKTMILYQGQLKPGEKAGAIVGGTFLD